ncbi:MAG: hypothetical protein A2033_15045 [Bacteroidetes bacterium GWA2_31_9]|nr:MAG: hypothetical protein A2033_15045 [Bacteroidetes bacterium GWA2_31_9]
MKTLFSILSILVFFNSIVFAQNKENTIDKALAILNQSKLDKANRLYNGFAYFEAAKLYEELAKQKFDVNKFSAKLGDCYFNMSKTDKAEVWYEKAMQIDSLDASYLYKYAQALRCNKKYSEADKWLEKYQLKKAEDSRAKSYMNNKDYLAKIKNQKSFFNVRNFEILNSEFADFGAVNFAQKVVFATARDVNMIIKNNYAWNEKPFLDIMVYDSLKDAKNKFHSFSNEINTKFHEGPLCFDSTGTIVYFTRNNFINGQKTNSDKGINNLMLYKAYLNNGKWTNIDTMPFNNKNYSVGHPALSKDGKKLFFTSNMPGGFGGTDLYYVDIKPNGFGNPINLGPEINTQGNEMFPFANDYNIYFSSDGQVGLGGLDIFYAKFSPDGMFKNITNLGEPVNSSMDDFCFVLNNDNQTGYLASNREGGKGDDDIYIIESDFLAYIVVRGIVTDSTDLTPITESKVIVKNDIGEQLFELTSDSVGKFRFTADFGMKYTITANKQDYASNTKNISTEGIKTGALTVNIPLLKQQPIALYGIIKDKKTGDIISEVEVTVRNITTNETLIDTKTTEKGDFFKDMNTAKIGDELKYEIIIQKAGYLAKTVPFNHTIKEYGIINMHEFLDIALDKIEVGADIGKLININPIYFDLNKSNIRADAATELEKIVKVMNENPTMVIELGSHTDCRATAQYNLNLSDKRAKSSAEYIRAKGIEKDRIYGKGYGESKLVNGCACEGNLKSDCSEEEHQLNRRTEFIIVKM